MQLKVDANYDFIDPVSITEERLLKLGFKKSKNTFTSENLIIECKRDNKWHIRFRPAEIVNSYWICKIDFVHQLQNLNFALTGSELVFSNNAMAV